jgi:methionyl-tRNA formyltransferase
MISVVFFGSFQQYSVQFLDKLLNCGSLKVTHVITTPPRPGNHGELTPTAVHQYSLKHQLPLYFPEKLDQIPEDILQPDFIVVAGYGALIPLKWLSFPKVMAINFHPSLLPQYAGRFPIEWAILRGEDTTGVSLIKMSEKFDKGEIVAQLSQPLLPTDTKESLYASLYDLGAQLTIDTLPQIISGHIAPLPQSGNGFYAKQLTREDGLVTAEQLLDPSFAISLDRMIRALLPWPGVFTNVYSTNGQKLTMKIFSFIKNNDHIELQKVQIEGKKPTFWSEISQHYSLTPQK